MILLNELGAVWEPEFVYFGLPERFDEEAAIVTMHDGLYEHRTIDFGLSEVHVRGRLAKETGDDGQRAPYPHWRPQALRRRSSQPQLAAAPPTGLCWRSRWLGRSASRVQPLWEILKWPERCIDDTLKARFERLYPRQQVRRAQPECLPS